MLMHRDDLKNHLHNEPLIQAIMQKRKIDTTKRELYTAFQTMRKTGISEIAAKEVHAKIKEYNAISNGYGELMQKVWGINQQRESIIRKYIGYRDADIDDLPDYVSD